jgi:hypothetical protein
MSFNITVHSVMKTHDLQTIFPELMQNRINNRLTTYAEDLLSQEQNGFRRNRSTMDNIFIM